MQLRGDEGLDYGRVMEVMAALQGVGVTSIGFGSGDTMMDRRGENLIRPLMLAIGLYIILLSTFFIAVSPEAKSITPPPVVVIQATELTFAPSAAAEARTQKKKS